LKKSLKKLKEREWWNEWKGEKERRGQRIHFEIPYALIKRFETGFWR